jgi:hypothetical protein
MEKQGEKAVEAPNAAQIELLETNYRFEANGDSRKEVHALVKLNSELGVRQFARLNFDYNRSFQALEIPLVRITHASGGIADILPSAISDAANPAVVDAPAYQDLRVKSVRILGLQPGDLLEYRVITTTTRHPLAPDFWMDHSFDRTGVVSREKFDLDLPASRKPEVRFSPSMPATSTDRSGEGDAARLIYRWDRRNIPQTASGESREGEPDISISTSTQSWESLSIRLDARLASGAQVLESTGRYEQSMSTATSRVITAKIAAKALDLTQGVNSERGRLEAIYDFVSQKIKTIDLPLGATGFLPRSSEDVLTTGYATQEDKFGLVAALASAVRLSAGAALTGYCDAAGLVRPTVFKHLIISSSDGQAHLWLDPSLEVAPFGVIPANSGKCAFVLGRSFFAMNPTGHAWERLDATPPFSSVQQVNIAAAITRDGTLTSKVHYRMRGQSELLLRLAFHQTPKAKWKEVVQLLALSDGFRGQVVNATVSDPYATNEPFTIEYEISQANFVDWSKKTVRIPAILPLLGLPDPPQLSSAAAIDLGTPLEVELRSTLQLPPGTTAQVPAGTSVRRDYADFASIYSAKDETLSASRHIKFLLHSLALNRSGDYNAFLHAVQNDQAQFFTLERKQDHAPKRTAPN